MDQNSEEKIEDQVIAFNTHKFFNNPDEIQKGVKKAIKELNNSNKYQIDYIRTLIQYYTRVLESVHNFQIDKINDSDLIDVSAKLDELIEQHQKSEELYTKKNKEVESIKENYKTKMNPDFQRVLKLKQKITEMTNELKEKNKELLDLILQEKQEVQINLYL